MKRPIHACILTTCHPIDDKRVNERIGKSFATAGMRVSWVGPDFNSIADAVDNKGPIAWHLYPQFSGKIGRLTSHRSASKKAASINNVDFYYCPDPDSAAIGILLAKRQGGRVIFDIHENYHLSGAMSHWGRGVHMHLLNYLVKIGIGEICRRCDLVIGVNRHVLSPYLDKIRSSIIVRSCAPIWFGNIDNCDPTGSVDKMFRLMHGKGALGRGTEVLLEAIRIAKQKIDFLRVVVFNIFTDQFDQYGEHEFRQNLEYMKISECVEFLDQVNISKIPDILKTCDVGIIAYGRGLGVGCLPNRLFEYMALGLPVIAPIYATEIREIVENENCGILVDFENPHSIADAIVYLYANPEECKKMGARGLVAFNKRHNWEAEVAPLLEHIRQWFQ